jgi:hypothetical protein
MILDQRDPQLHRGSKAAELTSSSVFWAAPGGEGSNSVESRLLSVQNIAYNLPMLPQFHYFRAAFGAPRAENGMHEIAAWAAHV